MAQSAPDLGGRRVARGDEIQRGSEVSPGTAPPVPADWRIPVRHRSTRGEVELFLDRSSAAPGERIGVRLSSDQAARLTLWRMGYEGGQGGRLVADLGVVASVRQAPPTFEATTGLVSCAHWSETFAFALEPSWPSGVYSVRADVRCGGEVEHLAADAILVVTPGRPHDVIVNLPTTTWVAYNAWGGRSLYDGGGFNGLPKAVAVSFDRPMKPTGSPIWELLQGHPFYTWEYPLVYWLEQLGYDVGYVSNLEMARGGVPVTRVLVSAGHDEYWSTAMRDELDRLLATGRSLLWAGANGMCWNIRLEGSSVGADRELTCYKDHLGDPMMWSDPAQATGRWGEWPLYRSEAEVLGLRWVDWDFSLNRRPAAWIAGDTRHPVFEGTGLASGDRIEGVVGDEWDALDPTVEVARSGVVLGSSEPLAGANLGESRGDTYLYRHNGGGLVMATGTTSWAWGLHAGTVTDRRTGEDARLQRITANFLRAAIDGCEW